MTFTFYPDMIAEQAIISLAILTGIVCVITAVKYRDLPAIGYIFATIYIACMYTFVYFADPPRYEGEFLVRSGYIILLVDILCWRVYTILKSRSNP